MCNIRPAARATFQIRAAYVLQAEHKRSSGDGALDDFGMDAQLVADRGADQVGAVGVEALLHQEIDLTQVDDAQVDRQFLGFADAWARLACPQLPSVDHPSTIHTDSI